MDYLADRYPHVHCFIGDQVGDGFGGFGDGPQIYCYSNPK